MKHIAENYFKNNAECSGLINFLIDEKNEPVIITRFNKKKLTREKKLILRTLIAAILINLIFAATAFSQLLTMNNVNLSIAGTTQLTVKGSVKNTGVTSIDNAGTIDFSGDWIHNASNNCFGASQGAVILNGANQNIGGTSATTFNNLTLQGIGTKTLQQNITVGGSYAMPAGILDVGNSILDLNSNTVTVSNSSLNAITSVNGYIISEDDDNSSKIKWNINNSTGAHAIPFGNIIGEKIPFTFNLTAGDAGDVTFSTYATAPANTPLPVTPTLVTHVRNSARIDNSANTIDRFWQIDNTGLSCNASLAFTYGNSEIAANGNTGMVAQNWNPASIAWDAPLAGQLNPLTNTVLVTNVSDFGAWAIATMLSPLPVTLVMYDARAIENKKVRNSWTTASEINNDFFTIERSKDGLSFAEAGIVNGAGSSNHINNYLFDDLKPYTGISYYRLKQTDYNGNFTYSEIKAVNISLNDEATLEVFPNPVIDFVNINSSYNDALQISITNAKGRIVSQLNSEKHNTRIDFTNYALGTYDLNVRNSKGEPIKSFKLIKK